MGKQKQKRLKTTTSRKIGKKSSVGSYESLSDENDGPIVTTTRKSSRNAEVKKRKKKRGGKESKPSYDDASFRHTLIADGTRTIHEMASDGNCLFRSLSDQLYQDWGNRHDQVRMDVCSFLEDNESEFSVFLLLDEEESEDVCDFKEYVKRMREDGEWGGNVELVSAARLYQRNILVFSADGAFSIESGYEHTSGDDLLISFHENHHYNSVHKNTEGRSTTRISDTGMSLTHNPAGSSIHESSKKSKKHTADDPKRQDGMDSIEPGKKKKKKGDVAIVQRRNDLCHCGSGLRYKKCCLATEKSQKRMAKWKEKNGIDAPDPIMDERDDAMAGNFKVLKI